MANACDTVVKMVGTVKALSDLYVALQGMNVNSKDVPLHTLAEYYGIDYDAKHIHVRGKVYFAEMENDDSGQPYMLTICVESAWNFTDTLFDEINHLLWDELKIAYREVEPGCEVFFVCDPIGAFPEECCVSSYGEPFEDACEDVYATVDEAIEVWCKAMGIERGERDKETMLDLINGYEYGDDSETYFYINEFCFEG